MDLSLEQVKLKLKFQLRNSVQVWNVYWSSDTIHSTGNNIHSTKIIIHLTNNPSIILYTILNELKLIFWI